MVTESIRVDKNILERLRMQIAKKTEGHTYGQIGAAVEKAIIEYLDKEDNYHEIVFTKKMASYVDTKPDAIGSIIKFVPPWQELFGCRTSLYRRVATISPEKEETILIRPGNNELTARIRVAEVKAGIKVSGEEIDNETIILLAVEDKGTRNNREPVGNYEYEEFKYGITIKNEFHITADRALAIYVPSYEGKELHAENIIFHMHLYRLEYKTATESGTEFHDTLDAIRDITEIENEMGRIEDK